MYGILRKIEDRDYYLKLRNLGMDDSLDLSNMTPRAKEILSQIQIIRGYIDADTNQTEVYIDVEELRDFVTEETLHWMNTGINSVALDTILLGLQIKLQEELYSQTNENAQEDVNSPEA